MKVSEFENAIIKMGLEPKDVRLEKNHVKWFICGGNKDYDIIVYDSKGKALVLPRFKWPEETFAIRVEYYFDGQGNVIGVTINDDPVMRDSRLDLDFL